MVGVRVVLPPPLVLMVPAPVKLRVRLPVVVERLPVPVSEGNVPVQPAEVPVPPVIVAEPVTEPVPLMIEIGMESFPDSALPVYVIVKGADRLPLASGVNASVALNWPLWPFATPVRVAVPVALTPLAVKLPVAFTVRVVLMVSASAAPATSSNTASSRKYRFKEIPPSNKMPLHYTLVAFVNSCDRLQISRNTLALLPCFSLKPRHPLGWAPQTPAHPAPSSRVPWVRRKRRSSGRRRIAVSKKNGLR